MGDVKFNNLISDIYKKIFSGGNLVVILYSSTSPNEPQRIIGNFGPSTPFRQDIIGLIEKNPNMLYVKSKLTGNEITVSENELENYKIKEGESTIYIKCKSKMEVALMY